MDFQALGKMYHMKQLRKMKRHVLTLSQPPVTQRLDSVFLLSLYNIIPGMII